MADEQASTPSGPPEDRPAGPPALTLQEILDGKGVPFWVDGHQLYIRQPTTAEYDDAMFIQEVERRRVLAGHVLPELRIAELKSFPISDLERERFQLYIAGAEAAFRATPDESAQKQMLADRIARLQRILETRTLADEVADDRAELARDRWLTLRLLCDAEGKPMISPDKPEDLERWEKLPLRVKHEARRALQIMLGTIENLPFEWEKPREPESGSP